MTSLSEGKIGPHEGVELALMLSKKKPLAYFSDEGVSNWKSFPEKDFDFHVTQGVLVKSVFQDLTDTQDGQTTVTVVMYALPQEA